jgi:uncharacterized protein
MSKPLPPNVLALIPPLVQVAQPQKIIVFGSQANGTATPTSDIDFLVIMNHAPLSSFEASFKVLKGLRPYCRALGAYGQAVDLIIYSEEEVEWRYKGYDPIVRSALNEGIIAYERP